MKPISSSRTTIVKQVVLRLSSRTAVYPTHADLRPHAARYSTNGASVATSVTFRVGVRIYTLRQYFPVVADWSDFGLLGEQLSSPKCPLLRAKFDVASAWSTSY